MKNLQASESHTSPDDGLLSEYKFDYSKALPNRLATQEKKIPNSYRDSINRVSPNSSPEFANVQCVQSYH
jgi:hypothetical protein